VFAADLAKWRRGAPLRLTELVPNFDAGYAFAGNDGASLYFRSNLGAPRGRVIALDANRAGGGAREVVAEAPDALVSVRWVGKRLLATYLKDAHSEVRVFDTRGHLERTIALPGIGTTRGFSGQQDDATTYFSFSSFSTPPVVYEYRPGKDALRVFRAPRLGFEPSDYETRQVFATSKDGTRVPVFLTHKKRLAPDPSTPTYLYGYGGFNVSVTPWFDVGALVWMERGGVNAVAVLRGGGEYGKEWHEAGMRAQKQHVFDDFIASAEWLVANRLTSPQRLAISGRSNGGLLVGACLTQRPELFGAALPAVGVLDMLRYHKFTVGWNWAEEYGSSDDAALFRSIYAYSPLHNVRAGTRYPATLITAADHDDRVVPSHSFKFAAALQSAQAGDAPILLRVETDAGHGGMTPTRKRLEEEADRLAFLVGVLGRGRVQ
jgi:prolyl oligopeptidase